ncbi:MAG: universal stress protein [Desulfobaccales bacterium]
MYKKILLAYDGSKAAQLALAAGLNLAKVHGAELWALAVQESRPRLGGPNAEVQEEQEFANQQYGKLLEGARKLAQEAGIELKTLIRLGAPPKIILDVAQEGGFDLIILGHIGLAAIWELMGTTAEKVSRHAPCSVMIVR